MTTNRNFNDLYAFTQIVKLGNFSRAAQALGGAAVGAQPPHERFRKPLKYQAVKPHHPVDVAHGGGAAAV